MVTFELSLQYEKELASCNPWRETLQPEKTACAEAEAGASEGQTGQGGWNGVSGEERGVRCICKGWEGLQVPQKLWGFRLNHKSSGKPLKHKAEKLKVLISV